MRYDVSTLDLSQAPTAERQERAGTWPAAPLPVTVITGFLGSGKTTLLSKLLAHPGMERAAVIINEFGEVGLDHMLVTKPKDDVVLLSSGCLCCSIRGDLVNTLASMLQEAASGEIPTFDKVLVETTGLADPVPVLLSVIADEDLSEWYDLDGILTVIDAVHGASQLDDHQEAVKQVTVADRLLISKVDIAPAATVERLRDRLEYLNPGADIIEVVQGDVDPALLFNVHPKGKDHGEDAAAWLRPHAHEEAGDHAGHAHGRHEDGIGSFSVYYDGEITPSGLQVWMDMLGMLHGPDLLRVKGILNVSGKPIVVQAVQHLFHPLVELPEWPDDERRSRIVFITRGISRERIEGTLSAFTLVPGRSSSNLQLDPAGYERFITAIRGMRP